MLQRGTTADKEAVAAKYSFTETGMQEVCAHLMIESQKRQILLKVAAQREVMDLAGSYCSVLSETQTRSSAGDSSNNADDNNREATDSRAARAQAATASKMRKARAAFSHAIARRRAEVAPQASTMRRHRGSVDTALKDAKAFKPNELRHYRFPSDLKRIGSLRDSHRSSSPSSPSCSSPTQPREQGSKTASPQPASRLRSTSAAPVSAQRGLPFLAWLRPRCVITSLMLSGRLKTGPRSNAACRSGVGAASTCADKETPLSACSSTTSATASSSASDTEVSFSQQPAPDPAPRDTKQAASASASASARSSRLLEFDQLARRKSDAQNRRTPHADAPPR